MPTSPLATYCSPVVNHRSGVTPSPPLGERAGERWLRLWALPAHLRAYTAHCGYSPLRRFSLSASGGEGRGEVAFLLPSSASIAPLRCHSPSTVWPLPAHLWTFAAQSAPPVSGSQDSLRFTLSRGEGELVSPTESFPRNPCHVAPCNRRLHRLFPLSPQVEKGGLLLAIIRRLLGKASPPLPPTINPLAPSRSR